MSADKENGIFGDGLAEEVVNVLARIPGMKVVGRTSSFFFRGKDIEVAEIGRRLNVEHILEGSVRKVGSRLRVSAQLIKAANGFHLWSGRYDREVTDLFAIQDEITEAIAGALRIKLSLDGATLRRHVPDLRAYEAFLRGREHLLVRPSPESLARGKELLEHAIQLDPQFALPYSILGVHYTMQATLRPAREVIPLARAAQQEALRVDPSLPEAHALLGVCAGMDYCWSEAEAHWGLAMTREPVSRDVLFWYGNHYLLPTGRAAEAVRVESRVLDEDPLNLLYRRLYAIALQHAGRLVDAEGELRKVLEIDDPPWALSALSSVCAQQGRFEEALAATERAHALAPLDNSIAGQLAALLFRAGAMRRAGTMIEKLRCGQPYGAAAGLALFHALCGEFDQAARWAEKAIEERYPLLVAILGPFRRPSPQCPL
jgi:TolB-like protein/Flp pilus assembly protein TadD